MVPVAGPEVTPTASDELVLGAMVNVVDASGPSTVPSTAFTYRVWAPVPGVSAHVPWIPDPQFAYVPPSTLHLNPVAPGAVNVADAAVPSRLPWGRAIHSTVSGRCTVNVVLATGPMLPLSRARTSRVWVPGSSWGDSHMPCCPELPEQLPHAAGGPSSRHWKSTAPGAVNVAVT